MKTPRLNLNRSEWDKGSIRSAVEAGVRAIDLLESAPNSVFAEDCTELRERVIDLYCLWVIRGYKGYPYIGMHAWIVDCEARGHGVRQKLKQIRLKTA